MDSSHCSFWSGCALIISLLFSVTWHCDLNQCASAVALSHSHLPQLLSHHHIQHHSNLRERDGANSAYFCSLNLWQRGTGSTLPSCVAALACLDSWIQCGMNVILVWAKPCRAVSLDYEKLNRFGQWRQCGLFIFFLVKVFLRVTMNFRELAKEDLLPEAICVVLSN